jgi:hypothetical protein
MGTDKFDLKYAGVKGWLRLFVAYLRIIKPIVLLLACGAFYGERTAFKQAFLGDANKVLQAFDGIMAVYFAAQIGLVIYAFRVGGQLRRIAAGAIKSAKRFVIVHCLVDSLLLLLVAHFISVHGVRLGAAGKIIAYVLWGAILYSYLSLSRRVRATYFPPYLPNQVSIDSGTRTNSAHVPCAAAGGPLNLGPSVEARLAQLRQMYDRGLITETTYYKKQAEMFKEVHKRK